MSFISIDRLICDLLIFHHVCLFILILKLIFWHPFSACLCFMLPIIHSVIHLFIYSFFLFFPSEYYNPSLLPFFHSSSPLFIPYSLLSFPLCFLYSILLLEPFFSPSTLYHYNISLIISELFSFLNL